MSRPSAIQLLPVTGLPEIRAGDRLGELIAGAMTDGGLHLRDGDVVVVSSKIVSKAMGLRVPPDQRAVATLHEATRVVAERRGTTGITRIVHTHAGPVMAAAGIDASNTGDDGALLLPRDPDAAARALHAELRAAFARGQRTTASPTDNTTTGNTITNTSPTGGSDPPEVRFGVVLTDTAGRPWRAGQVDFALGAAGVTVLVDHREQDDDDGRPLRLTARAVADELAAAADLVKGKTRRVPVVLARGVRDLAADDPESTSAPGAGSLVRQGPGDWFRYGHVEAVQRALGIEPGSAEAVDVGMAPADPGSDSREDRIARACAVALHPQGLGDLPTRHPRAHLMRDHTDLSAVRTYLVSYGMRVEAPDQFTLGVAIGRLLVALAGHDVPARVAQRDDVTPQGRPRASALLLFV